MHTLYTVVLVLHVLAGTLGLVAMVPPLLARKGARLHRRAGWAFTVAMAVVAATGGVMALSWLAAPDVFRADAGPTEARLSAVFLALIGALTGNAIVQSIFSLRQKGRASARPTWLVRFALVLLGLLSMVALVQGISSRHVLSCVFGAGGIALLVRDARFTFRPFPSRHAYLYQHIQAAGTACISAVTAFLVLGAPRLVDLTALGLPPWLLWVLPGAVMGPLFQRSARAMQHKLERVSTDGSRGMQVAHG